MGERNLGRRSCKDSKERKELGPYPEWEMWKHSLFDFLQIKGFKKPNEEVEEILHEWYVIRRRKQLRIISDGEFDSASTELDEKYRIIVDREDVITAFKYISNKTENKEGKEKFTVR